MCQFQRGEISSMWCSEEEHAEHVKNAKIREKWIKGELDDPPKLGEVNRITEKPILLPDVATEVA